MTASKKNRPGPVRTMIYGSCVSRDTFEFLGDDFVLNSYVARQSLISAGTSATEILPKLSPIASSFQQRMVRGDLHGDLFRVLKSQAPQTDLLVVDLVDERGGVIELGEGRFVSKLSEFWRAGGREASSGRRHLEFGSDDHFEKWTEGVRRFVGELFDLELLDRTVVIKAPWAELTDTDESFELPNWMMDPVRANGLYVRYFDYLASLGLEILELPPHLVRTSESHKWGISPYHFMRDAYEFLAGRIRQISISTRLPHGYDGLPRRNTAPWGAFTRLDSPEEFLTQESASGQFSLVHKDLPTDFLVEDNGSDTTLVSFHAALGRAKVDPPVFTMRSASEGLGFNRVFISDPSLLSAESLGLAWFLGTAEVNLTRVLSRLLNVVQQRLGAEHLVLFGMSGGGFAALNVSHQCPGSLAVPVNPQTRVLDYAQVHWQAMAEACFGVDGETAARSILEAHPRADMRRVYADGFSNTVIYVQNSQDSHVTYQMIPWFDAIGWQGASILAEKWGNGHVPPTPAELRKLLSEIEGVHGDWAKLATIWKAQQTPSRAWVKEVTGR